MTLAPTDAIAAIRDALSTGTEREAGDYATEGRTPAAAFEPASRDELASALRIAGEGALTVVPQGSRTAIAFGRPLDAYDIALDTRGLRRTVEYVPDDLTVTVEAGRRLAGLQAELAEHGQYLTVDPPPSDDVTIGGLLATARPGAWRGLMPAARDLILGMRVALPSGEVISSGGRVVKNVTGYDLQRLHTGALGAFGVIVEATFKIAPLPTASRTLVATAPTVTAATATAHRVWDASPALRALTILTPEAASHLGFASQPAVLLELIGKPSGVDRSARDLVSAVALSQAEPGAWHALRSLHGGTPGTPEAEANTVLRIGVPPARVAAIIEAVSAQGGLAWAYLAAGSVIARFETLDAAAVTVLRATAEEQGGFLVVESGPAVLRSAIETPAGDPTLVRALRDQFDLRRTINRGRWGASL